MEHELQATAHDAMIFGDQRRLLQSLAPEAMRFLRQHASRLADMPFWTFSSGSVGNAPASGELEPDRERIGAEMLHARGHVVLDGGLVPLVDPRPHPAIAPVGFVGRPHQLARVGVAFDGSAESVVALAHGGLLAEERECERMVLTVEDSDHLVRHVDVPDRHRFGGLRGGRPLAGASS